MIYFKKVLHTIGGVEEDITKYVTSLQINKGSEATKNTINIEITSPEGSILRNTQVVNGVTSHFFINDSNFQVYLDYNPITSQDPIIVATLSTDAEPMDNNGKYKFKLKCTDKSAMLLNKVWAESITEENNFNTAEAIINIIGHLNGLDGDYTDDMTTNNVILTKKDGSSFPKPITIAKIWKPGYEWLNELSQIEYTGEDRPYVYWVDAQNDLHWHYPYQKNTTTLTSGISSLDTTIPVTSTETYPTTGFLTIDTEVIYYSGITGNSFTGCLRGQKLTSASSHTSGTQVGGLVLYPGKQDIYALNVETTEDQTFNFIIYNGGPTPAGYEYLDYTLDETQIGKKFRMKFVDWNGEAKDMTNRELLGDRTGKTWGDTSESFPQPNGSPIGIGNPWSPNWLDEDGNTISCTTDEQYQAAFESELRARCETKAKTYYSAGRQKFKASCQMRYSSEYNINDLVSVTYPKFSKTIFMRVKDIKIQVNKSGILQDIDLEEDISPIVLGD